MLKQSTFSTYKFFLTTGKLICKYSRLSLYCKVQLIGPGHHNFEKVVLLASGKCFHNKHFREVCSMLIYCREHNWWVNSLISMIWGL